MTYVTSDIHGCYDQYLRLLQKVKFSDDDTLYVLGDVVDWGEKSMEVLRDMSMRGNVFPIAGNHEYFALDILGRLGTEFTEENLHQLGDILEDITHWQEYGGGETLRGYAKLSRDEREAIYEYLTEFCSFVKIIVGGQKYVLTHSGVPHNAKLKNLSKFDLYDFISASVDYNKIYFDDAILVTGHTPTFHLDDEYRGKVFRKNNHLAIDTGGVFGGTFACVYLETNEEFYVT